MKKSSFLFICGALLWFNNVYAFETLARNAILMDFDTGEYLYAKNIEDMVPPASMSKLMTVYILMSKIKDGSLKLDDTFKVSENAWRKGGAATGGSTMFLSIGDNVSVDNLIKGIVIQSGNDACIVVAENISGSEEDFAVLMNKTARKIGLKNSSFANSTGLPHPDHKMSVEDLAILSQHIIREFPDLYHYFSQKEFTYNNIKQGNRNPLLYTMKGADGLKTGHTEEAGFCLAATVQKNNRRLIEVMSGMNSNRERSEEAERLMSWGFREFENHKLVSAGQKVGKAKIWYGVKNDVELEIAEDFVKTIHINDTDDVKIKVEYEEPVKAPIKTGQEIGKARVFVGDEIVKVLPVVATNDVDEVGMFGKFISNVNYFIFGKK